MISEAARAAPDEPLGGSPGADDGLGQRVGARRRWPFWPAVAAVVLGLVATGALTWVSASSYDRQEKRLLSLRGRDVAALLTAALPSVQTPLASAAALANATGGDVKQFMRFITPYVGRGQGRPFVSVSLWRVGNPRRGPLAVDGRPPELASLPQRASSFLAQASATSRLSVVGLLGHDRLGYAFTGSARGPFAAYGESALPLGRYSPPQNNRAFADINYALYLGASANPAHLVIATVRRLPLPGRRYIVRVPFGNASFTAVVAARGPLAGPLVRDLPWAVAIVGVLLTLGAGALTARLIQRRRRVERLADQLEQTVEENRALYAEQRNIAQTLQHALLPDELPQLPGLQVGARYEAGVQGVDIGGDWYDLIVLPDRRLLLVVGDVSGRGLQAATTMASLRFGIHAYTAQGDDPPTILRKLSGLVSVSADGQLATVLCVLIDPVSRELSFTNAGHLPPLMLTGEGAEFVRCDPGLPVGVDRDVSYSSTTISAPPGATLLAFTDGLVERRGESVEVGLERLRVQVQSNHLDLEPLLTKVVDTMKHDASDDTAIAAIRWVS